MWLENKLEPYHGRFYKCSKDTLKISEACCNVMVQFVLCTQALAKEVDGVESKYISRPGSRSFQRESLFVIHKAAALNGYLLVVLKQVHC